LTSKATLMLSNTAASAARPPASRPGFAPARVAAAAQQDVLGTVSSAPGSSLDERWRFPVEKHPWGLRRRRVVRPSGSVRWWARLHPIESYQRALAGAVLADQRTDFACRKTDGHSLRASVPGYTFRRSLVCSVMVCMGPIPVASEACRTTSLQPIVASGSRRSGQATLSVPRAAADMLGQLSASSCVNRIPAEEASSPPADHGEP